MPSVSIHTLGCKLNYAESGALGDLFLHRSFDVVPFGSASDVTVINTCSVTDEADRKCRQTIRRALRANPDTFLVVTGCYAQLRPDEIAAIPGVDAVMGAREKLRLFDYLGTFEKAEETQVSVSCIDEVEAFGPAYAAGERTRAFLKIQDGCDYVCSFCTIPRARGRSRSASIESIAQSAADIAASGFREVVLSGVNIGLFGNDTGETLPDLLHRLDQEERIDRYRISSIEPNLLTDEIIDLVAASNRFMPHFHLPLQSGDDEILGRMRRRYRSAGFRERVERIHDVMPDACIGCDVIVGFPGETDAHFERTLAFMTELPISYLHVFTYSERPDTAAEALVARSPSLRVSRSERSGRNKVLRLLSQRKRRAFYERHLGTERAVLWEEAAPGGTVEGFTDNYIRVASSEATRGEIASVFLEMLDTNGRVRAGDGAFMPLL